MLAFFLLLTFSCSTKEQDTSTSTSTSVEANRDDCLSDQDCTAGTCISYAGNNVCQEEPYTWYHECDPNWEETSDCCDDTECTEGDNGSCMSVQYNYCGGIEPPENNLCHYDQCESNNDCDAQQACLPKGIHGSIKNRCVPASCTEDSDCTAGEAGQCSMIWDGPTCSNIIMSCTYQEAECRRANGCEYGDLCIVDSGATGAICHEAMPLP